MPEFISKPQYKTYERGEFSDEKSRSLEETLQLIKDFPWNQQRGVDIQPTGPSVTIQDEYVNYLKIGLYFNGKFCLYYLDSDNHLYEYHTDDLVDACKLVADFFGQKLDLSAFEKHFFNVGNQKHFVTQYFEYRIKLSRVLMLTSFLLIIGIMFSVLDIAFIIKVEEFYLILLMSSFFGLFGYVLFRIYYNAICNRNNYLQISKGNDIFSFGYDENEITTYNKKDIDTITACEPKGNRNPNMVSVFEIAFKGGTSIKFSNMLIPDSAFRNKFPEGTIINGDGSPIWKL
jgi:hypothetical protein